MSAYKLTDGSKLNLVLKREAVTPTTNSGPSRQNYRPTADEIAVGTLEEELTKTLRKHFKSDADAKKVIATFMSVSFFVYNNSSNGIYRKCIFSDLSTQSVHAEFR